MKQMVLWLGFEETGHLLKQAATMGIDRYFIDHAYLDAGYHGDWWVDQKTNIL